MTPHCRPSWRRKELADFRVAIGGDGADLGDFLVTFLEFLTRSATGFHRQIDTTLQIHRVCRRQPAWRLRERSPQPARSRWWCRRQPHRPPLKRFAHHLRAHVFELVSSSISLATVTPSLVMRAHRTICRARRCGPGAQRTFTALLRISTPRSMRSRASTPNLTSLADIMISVFDWSDPKDRATGRVLEGCQLDCSPQPSRRRLRRLLRTRKICRALTRPSSSRRADW